MSVYVHSYDNRVYGDKTCLICQGATSVFKIGLKDADYEALYYTCGKDTCMNKAIDSMKDRLEKLGLGKPKKREVPDDTPVPYQLDGYDHKRLSGLPADKLESLCIERGVPKSGSKAKKIANLLEWKRNGFSWPNKKLKANK